MSLTDTAIRNIKADRKLESSSMAGGSIWKFLPAVGSDGA